MSNLIERLLDWAPPVTAVRKDCIEAAERIAALENALRALAGSAGTVMRYLEEDGPKIVPHLVDSDDNPGQRCREDVATALNVLGY